MKRTSSAAFTPAPQETLPLVSNLISLFVGLNPVQFQCLQDDRPILPDPYSERFGLRSDPIKASERAHYFMSWTQENHIKKYMICQIHISAIGYMYLMENNILQKGDGSDPFRPGYFRWYGPLHKHLYGKDQWNKEFLIYNFDEEYFEIV